MSFYALVDQYENFDFPRYFEGVTGDAVERSLAKDKLGITDFLNLLSPKAAEYLEPMAQKAHQLTIQYFGKTIQLFIPLYLYNHCSNQCAYCGFNRKNDIIRRTLSLREIEAEARAIAFTGMRHVLFLTGESPYHTPMDYLIQAAECLKRHFSSVSIEIFPLDEADYRSLQQAGVDGMTLFQETYDQEMYRRVHLAGRKTDYRYRLDDKSFVQFMTALRLFSPKAGITVSTRETARFRDKLLSLGATRYSAGSYTGVGGYAEVRPQSPQFEITDTRCVEEVVAAIVENGYQPVFKDWDAIV